MQAMGVAAAHQLPSDVDEHAQILAAAASGELRLLYVSPDVSARPVHGVAARLNVEFARAGR